MEDNETMPKFCRPVSSLMDSLAFLSIDLDKELFLFIFKGDTKEFWESYIHKSNYDLLKFWKSLDIHNRAKLAQYIEAITDKFDVENSMSWNDLKILSKTPNSYLATKVRNMNVESYGLNLDENAVIKYIVKNKKAWMQG